jgi:hypothetical protein
MAINLILPFPQLPHAISNAVSRRHSIQGLRCGSGGTQADWRIGTKDRSCRDVRPTANNILTKIQSSGPMIFTVRFLVRLHISFQTSFRYDSASPYDSLQIGHNIAWLNFYDYKLSRETNMHSYYSCSSVFEMSSTGTQHRRSILRHRIPNQNPLAIDQRHAAHANANLL